MSTAGTRGPRRHSADGTAVRSRIVSVRIPEDLYLELRVLFTDPHGRARYGVFGQICEQALRAYVASQKVAAPRPAVNRTRELVMSMPSSLFDKGEDGRARVLALLSQQGML